MENTDPLDTNVIKRAYGWMLDEVERQVYGLTAGDQNYEPTGIYIPQEDIDRIREDATKGLQSALDAALADNAAKEAQINGLKYDNAQLSQELSDIATAAHMIGAADANDKIRALEAERDRLRKALHEIIEFCDRFKVFRKVVDIARAALEKEHQS